MLEQTSDTNKVFMIVNLRLLSSSGVSALSVRVVREVSDGDVSVIVASPSMAAVAPGKISSSESLMVIVVGESKMINNKLM